MIGMWRREKNNLTLLRPTSYMLHDILTHYTCKVELITVESQDSYTDVIDSTRLVNCIQNSSEFQQLANSIKTKMPDTTTNAVQVSSIHDSNITHVGLYSGLAEVTRACNKLKLRAIFVYWVIKWNTASLSRRNSLLTLLTFLWKDLDMLKRQVQIRKTNLGAKLQQKEKLTDVDEHWLSNSGNIVDEQHPTMNK